MNDLSFCRPALAALIVISGLAGCGRDEAREMPARNWSQYVTVGDGVRLAVDIWLPARKKSQQLPAAVQMTRYHRAQQNPSRSPSKDTNYHEANRWTRQGYAFVIIDARGSGASFGTRSGELSAREIEDYSDVLDWIARQEWSTGSVGAYGTSYASDTAELLARTRNPHLRAVGLLFGDFDIYEDVVAPGGLVNAAFAVPWPLQNDVFDRIPGAAETLAGYMNIPVEELNLPAVKPVDGADGPSLLRQSAADHAGNARLLPYLLSLQFRDDTLADGNTLDSMSPFSHQREIESSQVPMFVLASWLDAAAGRGALQRLATFSNTQEVHVGSWSHGGLDDSDPFKPVNAPASPSEQDQFELLRRFFDRYVKGGARPDGSKRLRYYTMVEDRWRETNQAQLPRPAMQQLYFGDSGTLVPDAQTGAASDSYQVDAMVTSGSSNRWAGQASGEDIRYPDRAADAARLLSYQTEPYEQDTRITGTPVVHLQLTADQPDAAVFAYLEDVAPDGRVTYITEGQLRLAHRKVADVNLPHRVGRVPRSFMSEDAMPLAPEEVAEVSFDLLPTSVRIARGHRLRVSIAGADAGAFLPVSDGPPATFDIHRGALRQSRLELPVAMQE